MTAFEQVLSRSRAPSRTVSVPLSCFADSWRDKPDRPPLMGLRVPSEGDVQTARAQAEIKAKALHKEPRDRASAYNDALMRWVVARGTTNPQNVNEPWFAMAEDTVYDALTTEGVKYLFGELERFSLEHSPLQAPATDEQVFSFAGKLLAEQPFAGMRPARERRARRLIAYLLDELVRPEPERG